MQLSFLITQIIVYVIIVFVAFGVFRVNTTAFLALSISLWAGLLFAVGGIIKNLVESVIFLFATHPYDVGGEFPPCLSFQTELSLMAKSQFM
jgi:small-conductance mechanosensitive channel